MIDVEPSRNRMKNPFPLIPLPDVHQKWPMRQAPVRETVWKSVIEFLESPKRSLAVVGPWGSGKSAFLLYLREFLNVKRLSFCIYISCAIGSGSKKALYSLIVEQLEIDPSKKEKFLKRKRVSLDDFVKLNYLIRKSSSSAKYGSLLILDDLDKFSQLLTRKRLQELLHFIRSLMDTGIFTKIILSANIDAIKEITRFSLGPTLFDMEVVPLLPLTLQEAKALIAFYLGTRKSIRPFTEKAFVEIWRRSKGNPRELIMLCRHSFDLMVQVGKKSVDLDLVKEI